MVLGCCHTVCLPCVDTSELADVDTCPVCQGPLGTPVPNHALAAVLQEIAEEPRTRASHKRQRSLAFQEIGPGSANFTSGHDFKLTPQRAAIVDMKATAAMDRQAYLEELASFLENTRAHGNRTVAAYSARAAEVIKDAEAEADVMEVNAAAVEALAAATAAGVYNARYCVLPAAVVTKEHALPRLAVCFAAAAESVADAAHQPSLPLPSQLAGQLFALHNFIQANTDCVKSALANVTSVSQLAACMPLLAAWGPPTRAWAAPVPAEVAQYLSTAIVRAYGDVDKEQQSNMAVRAAHVEMMWAVPARHSVRAIAALVSGCDTDALCEALGLPREDIVMWLCGNIVDAGDIVDFYSVVSFWRRALPCTPVASAEICNALRQRLCGLHSPRPWEPALSYIPLAIMKVAIRLTDSWPTMEAFQGVLDWCLRRLRHQAWCAAAARILEEATVPSTFVRVVFFAVLELLMRAGREWTPLQKARVLGSFVARADLLSLVDQGLARASLELLPIRNMHVETLLLRWQQ